MEEKKNQAARFRERNTKVNTWAAFVVFLLIAVFLVAGICLKDRDYSAKENRSLQMLPAFDVQQLLAGNTQEALSDYAADQFAFRYIWRQAQTFVTALLGGREAEGVYKGSGGYLIRRFEEPDEALMQRQVKAIKSLKKESGDVNFYMAVVPTAAEILKNRLPKGAPTADQAAYLESWQKEIGDTVTYIDVSKILRNHKDEEIYYHTDSDWTTLGAYYAYKELSAAMGVDTASDSFEAIPVSDSFRGDLAALSGLGSDTQDTITVYFYQDSTFRQTVEYVDEQEKTASLYDSTELAGSNPYNVFLRGNHGEVKINSTSASTGKLLILKDSYANSIVPFLVPGYREIILVDPRYYYGDIGELITEESITDVLVLYNADTLSTDTSLASLLEEQ